MSEILDKIGLTAEVLRGHASEPSAADDQVAETFGYKWAKRDTYESAELEEQTREWLIQRYCQGDPTNLDALLDGGPKVILDAGCGSAFSAAILFGDRLKEHHYVGVDISTAVDVGRERFAERGYPGDFVQWSLTDVPIEDESIDIVFSEGVLTFTESTEESIAYLASKLKKGGRFLFYVYAKKAVIREFTDDHIREAIATMDNQEAWEALVPLSKLGAALGELNVDIEVPEDIPYLGIKKGKMDIQRFFYWNFCKAFYRPDYSIDTMNLINFDWFRPTTCHRHTEQEVRDYCAGAGLAIEHLDVQDAGITAVAIKQ
jgi:arsenite methyltransferase